MAGKLATNFMPLDQKRFVLLIPRSEDILDGGITLKNGFLLVAKKVVITSINIDGNLYLIGSSKKEKDKAPDQFKIMIPKIPAYFTGTGDLMTALLLGWSNKYPDNLARAAELAVSSLQELLHRTINDYKLAGFDPKTSSLEIRLIQSQDVIRNPNIKFNADKYS